jgi:hypothetical protein
MRVLIVTDDVFASREQSLLARLEVGLADEGVRVVHAIPKSAAAYAPGDMIARMLVYPGRIWPLALPATARKLSRDLKEMLGEDDSGQVDIVHVLGGSAWSLGMHLAGVFGAGLAIEVWRSGLVDRARQFMSQFATQLGGQYGGRHAGGQLKGELGGGLRTGLGGRVQPVLLFAPDPRIEKKLAAAVGGKSATASGGVGAGAIVGTGGSAGGSIGGVPVRCVPWGVYAARGERKVLDPTRSPAAMVIGTGRDTKAFAAAFEGLAAAAKVYPELMIFCDAQAARRAELHRLAKKLGLLGRMSLIDELEGRRDLLVSGDLLIQPEAGGEARSVTLDAMGNGMVVIAAVDAEVSSLIDGRTARLITKADGGQWAAAVKGALTDRAATEALAASASAYVREHHRVSAHIRGVLDGYEALGSGKTLAFADGRGR